MPLPKKIKKTVSPVVRDERSESVSREEPKSPTQEPSVTPHTASPLPSPNDSAALFPLSYVRLTSLAFRDLQLTKCVGSMDLKKEEGYEMYADGDWTVLRIGERVIQLPPHQIAFREQ